MFHSLDLPSPQCLSLSFHPWFQGSHRWPDFGLHLGTIFSIFSDGCESIFFSSSASLVCLLRSLVLVPVTWTSSSSPSFSLVTPDSPPFPIRFPPMLPSGHCHQPLCIATTGLPALPFPLEVLSLSVSLSMKVCIIFSFPSFSPPPD